MKVIYLFLFVLSSLLCSAQQNISSSFQFGDSLRSYTIYIPQAYLDNPSTEVPLLLNLHGYGSVNWQQEFYGDFRPIADVDNFIICHPNGLKDTTGSRFWNVGFSASNQDDLGFLSALIDTLSAQYNINDEKVFSTGMSNGGFMSHKLACELPDKIKAIASVTGSMTINQFSNCPNMNAIPVMQIHGTADPTVPYDGNAAMIAVENVVGFWVNHNGCDSVAIQTEVPNNNTTDNSTATRYDFNSNCADDAPVVFYKVNDGEHTWPGSVFLIPGAVTNLDFDASAVIWKFFCPESKYTSIRNETKELKVKVFPNPSSNFISIILEDNQKFIDFKIYNSLGHLVMLGDRLTFNVHDIDNGIYFLKIKTKNGVHTEKILKK